MPLQIRRGTTAERITIRPVVGELIYDTDIKSVYVGDSTDGGVTGTLGGVGITVFGVEQAQDAAAAALAAGTHNGISFTYDDVLNKIDAVVGGGTVNLDIKGSVFSDDTSVILIDGVLAAINLDQTIKSNVIPAVDITYDLGSASKRFKDLYLSGSSINLGNATITATGTAVNLPAGSTIGGSIIGSGDGIANGSNYNINIIGDDSSIIVDSSTGAFTGDLTGSVFAADSSVIVDSVDAVVYATTIGVHYGNVFGNVTGDILGNILSTGTSTFTTVDINGGTIDGTPVGATTASTVRGTTITATTGFSGNLTGNVAGDVTGTLTGDLVGSVFGSVFNESSSIIVDTANDRIIASQVITPLILSSTNTLTFNSSDTTTGLEVNFYLKDLAVDFVGITNGPQQGPALQFKASRGTFAAPTALQSLDLIGGLTSFGHNGTDYTLASVIGSFIDPNGSLGAGIVPAKISLTTFPTNDPLNPKNLTINRDGYVSIGYAITDDAAAHLDINGAMRLAPLATAPTSPVSGMLAVANGVGWNPTSTGKHTLVCYLSSAWIQVAVAP